jgi:hypothetical protein
MADLANTKDVNVKSTETVKPTKETTVEAARTPREALEQERERQPIVAVAAHLPTDFDMPFAKAEPLDKTKEVKAKTEREKKLETDKAEALKKIGKILEEHDHRESSIPPNSEYWSLLNQYRTLNAQ